MRKTANEKQTNLATDYISVLNEYHKVIPSGMSAKSADVVPEHVQPEFTDLLDLMSQVRKEKKNLIAKYRYKQVHRY